MQKIEGIVPEGLTVEGVEIDGKHLIVLARATRPNSFCPGCGRLSRQVHSRYERQLLDLPSHGRSVCLRLRVRRFRCRQVNCPRRTFAERLGDGIAGKWDRRTARRNRSCIASALRLAGVPR